MGRGVQGQGPADRRAHLRAVAFQSAHEPGDRLANTVRDNVAHVVRLLLAAKPVLTELAESGKLRIVGAVYSLETGKVDWLPAVTPH